MPSEAREHEVSFCGKVQSWANALFQEHPEWPFGEADIETYGRGTRKRSDLRVLARDDRRPLICGEVKMPG
ncbi:MAG: hypothetical protein B1H04_05040, partial [Planctomycetales bacterium 4484_123]